jgi:hypothetical protein
MLFQFNFVEAEIVIIIEFADIIALIFLNIIRSILKVVTLFGILGFLCQIPTILERGLITQLKINATIYI